MGSKKLDASHLCGFNTATSITSYIEAGNRLSSKGAFTVSNSDGKIISLSVFYISTGRPPPRVLLGIISNAHFSFSKVKEKVIHIPYPRTSNVNVLNNCLSPTEYVYLEACKLLVFRLLCSFHFLLLIYTGDPRFTKNLTYKLQYSCNAAYTRSEVQTRKV